MRMSSRRLRAAALGALTAAALVAGSATATAAPGTPGHLVPKELPPHPSSDWYASDVTPGLPGHVPFCVEDTLPSAGATHRTFWTEYDTSASQIVVKAATVDAARKLAAAAEKKVRNCAADWEGDFPEGTASWRDYGTLPAEDGAHVYGVHTSYPDSEPGIHLYGVGRDGRTVTVVAWGEMGTYEHAPVDAFRRTTTTAVVKLYHP
ncbi:hypothetical protein [Streptomyces botrytidirepellens]|uniref:Secreted protein n=1 Tax=Streptomyces botrytidirepellens TaxID=2486417 RepID=A0A3M8WQP8_9ACTN|nr:hypothetical protein [Streptomyces botrytidirepellens]RNG30383.1 hypothetical protein EEJ42_10785 [Streptomyces botrytidirepellens]